MEDIIYYILIVLNINIVYSAKNKIECGYKQCPPTREGTLNVHLIPHSHMDAGWVKTFDEYYYGTKASVSSANVQLIYHSIMAELLHDKKRKFTFSETGYFWRWWKEQRPATRATFRTLVQEGRIEFAGGGWVHNDEATVNYLQIIDQYTWGLRKLNDTLGPCGKPKAGWQIDTYGHTREQASLLAQMGYDGLFIGRVDYKEREAMIDEDRMEFMWRGSDVLGKMSDIMTHSLYNLYNAPEGFCFDFLCNDEPIIDDKESKAYNADRRVNDFVAQIERQAKYYDHDNILVTMGGDFTYQSAANWFMNMDKIINHVNTHPLNMSDLNIFYSTPSCYLKAIYLYGRRDKAMYADKGDHLPYGSDQFTSRPSLKYFARIAHQFLQVVKQLSVISRVGDSFELHLLRHAASLVLHHDAITGTSQQHVTNDFIRIMSEAIDATSKKVSNILSVLTPTWGSSRRTKNYQQFVVCHQLNISQCRFLETQEAVLLLLYNPSSVKTYHYVRLPAIALHYSIRDFNDEDVEYQLVPMPTAAVNLPGRSSSAMQELFFEAENVPPLGYSAFYITPVRDPLEENAFKKKATQKNVETEQETANFISNEYLRATINKESGLLESIQHVDGAAVQVSQNFYYYSQTSQGLQSGAYSFRPDKERPTPVTERVSYSVVKGALVKEIRQRFTDWITQVIRLYRGEEFLEMEWIIGPVPIGSDLGKEVVSVYMTNITSNGEFFTDSNGRQMMKRTCWNISSNQPQRKQLPACYYPVTSRMCIRAMNTSVEICVLPDRTQGCTSYNEGELEFMIHRRLLTDDGFGLEESLNEEEHGMGLVLKGKHRMYIGNFRQEVDELSFSERMSLAARRWQTEPWMFFASGEKVNRRKWQNVRNKRYSALHLHGLPRHIHILTLEPWKSHSVLLRLENTLESPVRGSLKEKLENPDDYPIKTGHITVELRKVFQHMRIRLVRETTLAANQWLDDARQMDWSTRYVYNGGDEGILPEDADYEKGDFSKSHDGKETGYSGEDERPNRKKYHRYKHSDRIKSNLKNRRPSEYERRKRSLNSTENIVENMINRTIDEEERATLSILADKKIIDNETTHNIPVFDDSFTTENIVTSPKNFKINFGRTIRPYRFRIENEREKSTSDEENFSSYSRKRSAKRKKFSQKLREPDIPTDDIDDGVTRSMFEMYYRPDIPKNQRLPPEPKNRNQKTRRYRQNSDYEDATVSSEMTTQRRLKNRNRRKKFRHVDMPFFLENKKRNRDSLEDRERIELTEDDMMTKDTPRTRAGNIREKRRKPDSQEYDDPESNEEDTEREDDYSDRYRRYIRSRNKRAAIKDEDGDANSSGDNQSAEPEYSVTLRPTQIRTFVIWFHEQKKNAYVTR